MGITPDAVTKEQRQIAKAVNFGLLFGQGVEGLQREAKSKYGVKMSLREAGKAKKSFFANYPGLHQWQTSTRKAAERAGQVRTPGGRVYCLDVERNGSECLSTPIQGGEAECLLAAMAIMEPKLMEVGASLVNVIHDEVIVECDEVRATEVSKIVEESMV